MMASPLRFRFIALRPFFALGLMSSLASGSPAATPPLIIQEKGIYTYQAPTGWIDHAGRNGKQVVADYMDGKRKAMISVQGLNNAGVPVALGKYTKTLRGNMETSLVKQNTQPVVSTQSEFETSAGATACKFNVVATVAERQIESVIYVFTAPDKGKVIVTCTSEGADNDHYLPIFDATMKTMVVTGTTASK
jgi:hypothetical protein